MKAIIIGFGRMGQRHLQACQNLNIEVLRLYDLTASTSAEGIDIKPVSAMNADLDALKPDIVIIASTATSHFEYSKLCFTKEIPYILCEKPLCTSLQELMALQMLAKQYPNVRFAINHPMRFMPKYTQVKAFIEKENFGQLTSMSVQSGNMGAAMNATHYFEALRFITNEYAQHVWAWLEPQNTINPRGGQYQDHCGSIRLTTPSGKRLYLDLSQDQGHGLFVTYTCNYGQIHVDELGDRIYTSQRKNKSELSLPTTRYGMEAQMNTYQLDPVSPFEPSKCVLAALIADKNYPNLEDGIMTIKTLIAAYAASDLQTVIDVNHIPAEYYEKVFPWA